MRATRSKTKSKEKIFKRKRSARYGNSNDSNSTEKEVVGINKSKNKMSNFVEKSNKNKGGKEVRQVNSLRNKNKNKEENIHNNIHNNINNHNDKSESNIEKLKSDKFDNFVLSNSKKNKIIFDEDDENITTIENNNNNINNINNNEEEESTKNQISEETIDITEKLTNSFIYCREKEKEFIVNFLKNKESNSLFLCGQPGTGKTSLVNEIFKTCLPEIEYTFKISINCMSVHSVKDFYDEVFKFFNKTTNLDILRNFFSGGKEAKKYEQIANLLKSNKNLKNLISILNIGNLGKKLTPIFLLDEVDHFYEKNDDIGFFEIINLPNLSSCNLKIIMISNNPEFDKQIIPKIENRKIKIEKYVFQPYTHVEINKILTQKLQEIDFIQFFEENVIRFISSKLANKSGDIRPALEIVKQIILNNKEEFAKGKKIELREVMILLKQSHFQFTETIKNMTLEQKIVVTSIYFEMMNKETNVILHGEILKQYKKIKRENFNDDISLAEFDTVVGSLMDLGIVFKTKSKNKNEYKVEAKMEEIQLIFGEDERLFKLFRVTSSDYM